MPACKSRTQRPRIACHVVSKPTRDTLNMSPGRHERRPDSQPAKAGPFEVLRSAGTHRGNSSSDARLATKFTCRRQIACAVFVKYRFDLDKSQGSANWLGGFRSRIAMPRLQLETHAIAFELMSRDASRSSGVHRALMVGKSGAVLRMGSEGTPRGSGSRCEARPAPRTKSSAMRESLTPEH